MKYWCILCMLAKWWHQTRYGSSARTTEIIWWGASAIRYRQGNCWKPGKKISNKLMQTPHVSNFLFYFYWKSNFLQSVCFYIHCVAGKVLALAWFQKSDFCLLEWKNTEILIFDFWKPCRSPDKSIKIQYVSKLAWCRIWNISAKVLTQKLNGILVEFM